MFDAIVIGAGPAGSHAARRLAAAGWGVALLEKDPAPGMNVCCTGIVGQPCLDLLGVDPGLVYHLSSSATFIGPSGARIHLARPETVGFILDRPGLDRRLAEAAVAAGAELRCGLRVVAVEPTPNRVRVRASGDAGEVILDARAVILATGHGSRLPRALGMGKAGDCLVAAQAEVEAPGLTEVEVYADPELAPGGFGWLAPSAPGRGWAGILARRDQARAMDALLARLRDAGRVGVAAPPCFGALPIQPLPRTVAPRVMVVGEAAGQIKPTTGGGIYYGALCAEIAAEVLSAALAAGDLSEGALEPYETRWRARLDRELAVGYGAHVLWRRLTAGDVDLLFSLARRLGLAERVGRSARFSFDWHAPLLMQLAEWLPMGGGARAASSPPTS